MKRLEQRWPQEVMQVLARPPVAARGRYSGHIAPTCVCGGGGPPALVVSNGRSRGGPTRAAATPTAGSYRADIRRLHDLRRNPGPGVLVSTPRRVHFHGANPSLRHCKKTSNFLKRAYAAHANNRLL